MPHTPLNDADHVGLIFSTDGPWGTRADRAVIRADSSHRRRHRELRCIQDRIANRAEPESVPIRALTGLRAGDSPEERRIAESGPQGPDPKAKNHAGTRFSLDPWRMNTPKPYGSGVSCPCAQKSKFFRLVA